MHLASYFIYVINGGRIANVDSEKCDCIKMDQITNFKTRLKVFVHV